MTKKLIVDTDGAADDVRSLCMALQTPDVEIIAITTVKGTVNVDQATANIARTLRANHKKIPIYKGCSEPLIACVGMHQDDSFFFGKDGIGDQPNHEPAVLPEDPNSHEKDMPAALALGKLFREHSDVTLVCIGPLTNIALALKLDPSFATRPKDMVIMGGNVYGVGNMKSQFTAEFNFGNDPEAAHIVLAKMQCPITIVPWEAFFFDGKKHEKEVDFNAHLKLGTPLAKYLSMATSVCRAISEKNNRQYCYCDEIAMATAIDPEHVIRESQLVRGTVELNGEHTRYVYDYGASLARKR